MDKSQKLKSIILSQYKSIREFSKMVGVPNSTLVSALDNGIEGMAVGKVIKICDTLNIDIKTFEPLPPKNDTNLLLSQPEQQLVKKYRLLNPEGQERLKTSLDDLLLIDKYLVHTTDKDLPAETKAAHQEIYQKRLEDQQAKEQRIRKLVEELEAEERNQAKLIAKGGHTITVPGKTDEEIAEIIRRIEAEDN